MFNLDERYHSYLNGSKKLRIDGVEEKVKAYGYTDDGKDIDELIIKKRGSRESEQLIIDGWAVCWEIWSIVPLKKDIYSMAHL